MTRILIVDDHPLYREALRCALGQNLPRLVIVEAGSIGAALAALSANPDCDVALLDLSLPGASGFSGLAAIKAKAPKMPVIVISGHNDPRIVHAALELGAAGYIPKTESGRDLAVGVAAVLRGETFAPESLMRACARIDADLQQARFTRERLRQLTPQQLRIFRMICEGRHNKEIAEALHVAETTIKGHVSHILRKLNVTSRTRAVILATQINFEEFSAEPAAS